jgi:hypothetical protein
MPFSFISSYNMATNGVEWQCVYVLPENRRHVYGHLVGPSIHPPYLEVAVPSYYPTPNEHMKYLAPGSALTDLPVAADAADLYGHEHVQAGTFNDFLLRLKSGIGKHGFCLANYYRRRYTYHLQWIEYAVLLNDLPVCVAFRSLAVATLIISSRPLMQRNFSQWSCF